AVEQIRLIERARMADGVATRAAAGATAVATAVATAPPRASGRLALEGADGVWVDAAEGEPGRALERGDASRVPPLPAAVGRGDEPPVEAGRVVRGQEGGQARRHLDRRATGAGLA